VPRDGHSDPYEEALVKRLRAVECWRLLGRGELGRLAVESVDGVPDVFPVNYLVHSGCIYVRTAPGSKLVDIAAHPDVAFEVDGEDIASHWSVVVRGTARRLDVDADIEDSGILALESWSPTSKHDFVRLTPASVTGRRFHRRQPLDPRAGLDEPAGGAEGVPLGGGFRAAEPVPDHHGAHKPISIPHYPPPPAE
jgi:Predicted flavin-nucleotide-binding protein